MYLRDLLNLLQAVLTRTSDQVLFQIFMFAAAEPMPKAWLTMPHCLQFPCPLGLYPLGSGTYVRGCLHLPVPSVARGPPLLPSPISPPC